MIESLRVGAFKRLHDKEFSFSPNTTLIQGPNYSGKTTVLEAIGYALFGPKVVQGTATDLGKTEVSLSFRVAGKSYRAERAAKGASLRCNGEEVANSHSAVTKAVEGLVGLSGAQFAALRVSSEGEAKALLMLGGARLHNILETVTGADQVDRVLGWLKMKSAEAEGALTVLRGKQVHDLDEKRTMALNLNSELQGHYNSSVNAQRGLEDAQTVSEDAKRHLEMAMANNREYEKALERIRQDKEKRQVAEERLREAMAELESMQKPDGEETAQVQAEVQRAEEVAENLRGAEEACRTARFALESLEREEAFQADDLARYKAQIKRLPNLDSLVSDIAGAENEEAEAAARMGTAKAMVDNLERIIEGAVCPTCQRPFEEGVNLPRVKEDLAYANASYRSAFDDFSRAEGKKLALLESKSNAEKWLQGYELRKAEQQRAAKALEDARETMRYREDALRKAEAMAEGDDLPGLRKKLADLELKARLYGNAAERVTRARDDLEKAPMPDEDLHGLSRLDIAEYQRAYSESVTSVRAASDRANYFSEMYRKHYAIWQSLNEEVDRGVSVQEELKSTEERQGALTALTRFLRKHRAEFMRAIWDHVLQGASEFASSCTGGDIEALTQSESGKFQFVENGHTRSAEVASGAQKAVLGLGLRLALSDLMASKFDTLLLDEPTAAADAEVSLAISSALASTERQVIIVSHRALDGLAADEVIQMER